MASILSATYDQPLVIQFPRHSYWFCEWDRSCFQVVTDMNILSKSEGFTISFFQSINVVLSIQGTFNIRNILIFLYMTNVPKAGINSDRKVWTVAKNIRCVKIISLDETNFICSPKKYVIYRQPDGILRLYYCYILAKGHWLLSIIRIAGRNAIIIRICRFGSTGEFIIEYLRLMTTYTHHLCDTLSKLIQFYKPVTIFFPKTNYFNYLKIPYEKDCHGVPRERVFHSVIYIFGEW